MPTVFDPVGIKLLPEVPFAGTPRWNRVIFCIGVSGDVCPFFKKSFSGQQVIKLCGPSSTSLRRVLEARRSSAFSGRVGTAWTAGPLSAGSVWSLAAGPLPRSAWSDACGLGRESPWSYPSHSPARIQSEFDGKRHDQIWVFLRSQDHTSGALSLSLSNPHKLLLF